MWSASAICVQLRASTRAAIQHICFKHIVNDGDGCSVMRTNVQDMVDRESSSLTYEYIESSAVEEIVGLSHSLIVTEDRLT